MDAFSSLSTREKALVGIALLVGLLMIAYLYVWEPKTRQLHELRTVSVPESEQTLAWVRQALEQASSRPAGARDKIIEGPLLTVIEQTAEQAGVRTAIKRMQPNQNQAVRIWMENVVFDKWLRWVDLLKAQNVFVERASIVRETPGVVTARVTLARN